MRNSLLATAFVALSLVVSGCATNTEEPAPAPVAGESTGTSSLAVTLDGDYELAGSWVHGDVLVQFVSKMSEEGLSSVKLTVNGAEFDATFDFFTGEWTADCHKNALFWGELAALKALEQHLDKVVGKQTRPWQRLFASVAHLAAAPNGYTFLKRFGSPKLEEEAQHRETNSVGNDGVTYICKATSGAKLATSWGLVWAEHDSLDGEGGGGRNSAAGNGMHTRTQAYELAGCRLGRATASGGNGAGSCEGRCGAGCPRSYNWYFAKDCLDHDTCLDYHPNAPATSYSGDCGYEFSDADGDFLSGTTVGYSWTCNSVPSDCEDNGNARGAGL